MTQILKVSDYIAPRVDPLIHPGKRPPGSYIMDGNNHIFLIKDFAKGIEQAYIESPNEQIKVNDFLKRHHAALLEERIPVIAYGTNPCPGQLAYKFQPIDRLIVPVIKGYIKGWDTVYQFIYQAGYAYAQLIPAPDVTVEAWITLLDQAQYERMNSSEGVLSNEQHYRVGVFPHFQVEFSGKLAALLYTGNTKILQSPECKGQRNTVISIAEIPANGRTNPALFQEEMLNHGVDIFQLADILKTYKNDLKPFPGSPGKKLAYFLNQHFNAHNGGAFQCTRCSGLLARIKELTVSLNRETNMVSELPQIKRTLLNKPNQSPFQLGDVWH